jgi:hypothetical protein
MYIQKNKIVKGSEVHELRKTIFWVRICLRSSRSTTSWSGWLTACKNLSAVIDTPATEDSLSSLLRPRPVGLDTFVLGDAGSWLLSSPELTDPGRRSVDSEFANCGDFGDLVRGDIPPLALMILLVEAENCSDQDKSFPFSTVGGRG